MQQDQVKGVLERAITVLVTMMLGYMVKRGWIGESEMAALLPAVVLIPSLLYGWWINSNKEIVRSAAAIPGTVVVTQPALARSLPESNIVASVDTKVVTTEGVVVPPSPQP